MLLQIFHHSLTTVLSKCRRGDKRLMQRTRKCSWLMSMVLRRSKGKRKSRKLSRYIGIMLFTTLTIRLILTGLVQNLMSFKSTVNLSGSLSIKLDRAILFSAATRSRINRSSMMPTICCFLIQETLECAS